MNSYSSKPPQLKGLSKEILRYKRSTDGVELTGTLYLPPGYERERDGVLPCLLWAYPKEYKSKVRTPLNGRNARIS